MKKMISGIFALLLSGSMITSCKHEYTAQDYINDLKELSQKTADNATSYTKEDWKKVMDDFNAINKKGMKTCKNLTEEQMQEIDNLKKNLMKESKDFNNELKDNINDMTEKAGDAIKKVLDK